MSDGVVVGGGEKAAVPSPEVTSLNWLPRIDSPDSGDGREVSAGWLAHAAATSGRQDFYRSSEVASRCHRSGQMRIKIILMRAR